MNDYYQILEVEPNASQEQIKSQYRFLVQAWHPDKFGSPESKTKAEEKLKQINEAFNVLRILQNANNMIARDNIFDIIQIHKPIPKTKDATIRQEQKRKGDKENKQKPKRVSKK